MNCSSILKQEDISKMVRSPPNHRLTVRLYTWVHFKLPNSMMSSSTIGYLNWKNLNSLWGRFTFWKKRHISFPMIGNPLNVCQLDTRSGVTFLQTNCQPPWRGYDSKILLEGLHVWPQKWRYYWSLAQIESIWWSNLTIFQDQLDKIAETAASKKCVFS